MIDVVGLFIIYGLEFFCDNIFVKDGVIVMVMCVVGVIFMGKMNNFEWSVGGNMCNWVYGVIVNFYDLMWICVGFLGGLVVGLVVGYFLLVIGLDIGGLLCNLVVFCGVVGYCLLLGVVLGSMCGVGFFLLLILGLMVCNVEDVVLMLLVMVWFDMCDFYMVVVDGWMVWDVVGFVCLLWCDLFVLCVVFIEDYGFVFIENIVCVYFCCVMVQLLLVFGWVEEGMFDCWDVDCIFLVLCGVLFVVEYGQWLDDYFVMVGLNVIVNVYEGCGYSVDDIVGVLMMQGEYYQCWQIWFEIYDVVIFLVVIISLCDWYEFYLVQIDGIVMKSYYYWLVMVYVLMLVGYFLIIIFCGFDGNGMFFGLQIVGWWYDDFGVLVVVVEFEVVIVGLFEFVLCVLDFVVIRLVCLIFEDLDFLSLQGLVFVVWVRLVDQFQQCVDGGGIVFWFQIGDYCCYYW